MSMTPSAPYRRFPLVLPLVVLSVMAGCAPSAPPKQSAPEAQGVIEVESVEVLNDKAPEAAAPAAADKSEATPEPKTSPDPKPAGDPSASKPRTKGLPLGAVEEVMLGEPSLTAGVPGQGPITLEQIDAWLADPSNFREIKPILPLGLSQGASQITGLDENPLSRAKIELGRQLYFDPRLSADATVSCASCHNPAEGYSAHTKTGVGIRGQQGGRNSPVSFNRILSGPSSGTVASTRSKPRPSVRSPIRSRWASRTRVS
ncbi:MAG: cytochrome c peroxidase [Planctomycetaceae bacterium]